METVSLFNGNNRRYKQDLPRLVYLTDGINDVALKHIQRNTGLNFVKAAWSYWAQPKTSKQIVKLLLTYNFKTEYHDNGCTHNTIYLKGMHNVGFKVNTICFECCEHNGIYTGGLSKKSRLCC